MTRIGTAKLNKGKFRRIWDSGNAWNKRVDLAVCCICHKSVDDPVFKEQNSGPCGTVQTWAFHPQCLETYKKICDAPRYDTASWQKKKSGNVHCIFARD